MDTASALATIKACMAAPSNPVACVILRANGKSEEIVADQRKLGSFLGANPTIVGAIISLDVTVVVRSDNTGNKNTHSFPEGWEPNLKGDIILFRTDNDGGSLPFTLKEHRAWVAEGMPNSGPEEQEESENESMEKGSDDEESDDEESDDGEEEDLETFSERMNDVPVAELKKACQVLKLGHKGGKSDLIARLHAHAQENAQMDDSENDEEEEEEEEKQQPAQKAAKMSKDKTSKGKTMQGKTSTDKSSAAKTPGVKKSKAKTLVVKKSIAKSLPGNLPPKTTAPKSPDNAKAKAKGGDKGGGKDKGTGKPSAARAPGARKTIAKTRK